MARSLEPDIHFVRQLKEQGGDTLKKCYQCATCSVVCPISPEEKPFPRKEMIAAQWGLKDRLVSNLDVWLCHHCNDCSTYCPRGAKPGDVLSAIRSAAVAHYAWPKPVAKLVQDSRFWWVLFAIPVVLFLVVLGATGHLNIPAAHEGEPWGVALFFPTLTVDLIFIPLTAWVFLTFAIGISRFINDIHRSAVTEGKAKRKDLNVPDLLRSVVCTLPTILKHDKFTQCTTNKDRYVPHLLVFFSFIGLFIVTNVFFVALYILHEEGPYSQANPVKMLANISAVALITGALWMISNRLNATKGNVGKGSYFDWSLLILVLGLGATGALTEVTRLLALYGVASVMYFIHLVFVFCLFAYLPFSKLAHLVYRTVAMAYSRYAGREPCQ